MALHNLQQRVTDLVADYRDYCLLVLILLTSGLPPPADKLHKEYVTMYRRLLYQREKRGALASELEDGDDHSGDALMERVARSLAVVFDLAAMRRDFHQRDMEKHGRHGQP